MARMVQDIQESKQQLQAAMEEQAKQLEEHTQQLKDQQARSVFEATTVAACALLCLVKSSSVIAQQHDTCSGVFYLVRLAG
jgi:hypothetical protein